MTPSNQASELAACQRLLPAQAIIVICFPRSIGHALAFSVELGVIKTDYTEFAAEVDRSKAKGGKPPAPQRGLDFGSSAGRAEAPTPSLFALGLLAQFPRSASLFH